MVIYEQKESCCGCGACAAVCKKKAVHMEMDAEGFYYPNIDDKKCINCGMCLQVCPLRENEEKSIKNRFYAVRNLSEKVRERSSSGGVFSLLADYVLEKGGSVIGAGYDEDLRVVHMEIDCKENLDLIRRTKYVQSDMRNIYSVIKDRLDHGKWVLFTGTACQAEAVRYYLKQEYDKLILVDLVCYGVPSPGIWQRYITWLGHKYRGQITNFYFRDKRNKDNGHVVAWENCKGEMFYPLNDDPYCRMYFKNLMIRPSCHQCQFCQVERNSDFTIGDFWGIEKFKPELDDGMGTSLVITHTVKAEQIWEKLKKGCLSFACEKKDVLQPRLIEPTPKSQKRDLMMRLYRWVPFSFLIHYFSGALFRQGHPRANIGILTFHCSDNCGAMLQAYGLKKWLCMQGKFAEIVNYIPLSLVSRDWLIPIRLSPDISKKAMIHMAINGFRDRIHVRKEFFALRRNMRRFRKKYLIDNSVKLSLHQLKRGTYHTYIVGSDQIWCPDITNGLKPAYFGAFPTKKKKKVIAYAASIGNAYNDVIYNEEFGRLLNHVNVISTREAAAIKYIEQFDRKAVSLPDPVFLLEKKQWQKIEKLPRCEHYILIYAMEPNQKMYQYALQLSKEKGLKVIMLKSFGGTIVDGIEEVHTAGPAEFLGYIDLADYVITNSFHGTAFSIIFEKQFITFLHRTKGLRLINVLNLHGLESRICENDRMPNIDMFIDWDVVRNRNRKMKNQAERYLLENI